VGSFFSRFRFWVFDRFDIMSYSEFSDFDGALQKFCESIDNFVKLQDKFNKAVSVRLNLGDKPPPFDREYMEMVYR